MAVTHILFLFAAAVFVPVLALRLQAARALYSKLTTESQTDVQEEIVNLHNAFRRNVIPSARNMVKMTWSPDAAENDRIVARYCDLSKSNSLERRLKNTFCGENMYSDSYPASWEHVITVWYNESKNFKYGQWPFKDNDLETEHYTQLVWAPSYLIGCDVASCRRDKAAKYLYVCHYCHEGNDPDTENVPYQKGPPCGDCPRNCEDGLCTNPCLYYDEYYNCEKRARLRRCSHPTIQQFCKASCLCTTEIK
ncbi:cysteine-rich secretory protein 1 isoform X1 [Nannospalax galili]|uniref:cysteine-rich secretory protein 1 isoform X1 n=1 Tax=Nannospalax galili TaxID=1026970 RepID=UPI0004ED6721|nr:cysteine-rich secretory protein 1 isoform X1 [Nannospalax galili]